MTAIVLNKFQHSSIQLNKLANIEAERLQGLNSRGEIDPKANGNNIAFKAEADRLVRQVAKFDFEISKANKTIGALDTTLAAIDQMRVMVDQIKGLEEAAKVETDVAKTNALIDQARELKAQIAQMGESATFQGQNFFSGWGSETVSVGGASFTMQSVDLEQITKGQVYQNPELNVFNIESGDFDTSAYPDLIAAFGPDIINNVYSDFTGTLPDGQLLNGAVITANGPVDSSGVEFPSQANNYAGSHIQLPAFEMPSDFTISTWAKLDNPGSNWSRVFGFSNNPNSEDDAIALTRFDGGTAMIFHIREGGAWRNIGANNTIVNDQWAYWSVSAEAVTSIPATLDLVGNDATGQGIGGTPIGTVGGAGTHLRIYKDGNLVAEDYIDTQFTNITRDTNFFGASWNPADNTTDGAISDFTVFNKAQSDNEIQAFYNDVGLTGLENSFFTMSAEKLDDALDKLEGHFAGQQIAIEAMRDQLSLKRSLMEDNSTTLLSVDTEQVAVEANIAQLRQTLAVTSLGVTNQVQSNILSLFN